MTPAYQIILNGSSGEWMVRDINLAFRHIGRLIEPNQDYLQRFGSLDGIPLLAKIGYRSSFYYSVRRGAEERGFETLRLVEHNLDTPPGMDTAGADYDLINTFDPAYLLDKALVDAEHSDRPLLELSSELREAIAEGIKEGRLFNENDAKYIARLRRWQCDLGTDTEHRPIPMEGDAQTVLKALPDIVAAKFDQIAARAFKGETPAPADDTPGAGPRR